MMEFPGKKDIKVTASDALEFEPISSVPAKKGGGLRVALVLILVSGGAGAWSIYGDSLDKLWAGLWTGDEKGVPLIKAARGPVKVRPDNPGGLRVPDRDKLVYDRMQSPSSGAGTTTEGGAQNRGPERLLPSAEQPLPKPVAAPALKAKPAEKPVSKPALKPQPKIKPVAKIKPAAKPVAKVPTLKDVKTAKRPTPPPPPPQAPKAEAPESVAKPAPKLVAPKLAAPPKLAPVPEPVAAPKPALIARSRVYLVQLAAARSTQGARDEWAKLRTKNLDLLGDLGLSVTKADLGAARGVFYRLRAGPLKDIAAARSLCTQLAKRKIGCLIIKPGQ